MGQKSSAYSKNHLVISWVQAKYAVQAGLNKALVHTHELSRL